MNVNEYIASGVLESYIIGSSSLTERKDVEYSALQYPEIKLELEEIEKTFNSYIAQYSITPPAYLKETILSKISGGTTNIYIQEKNNLRIIPNDVKTNTFRFSYWAIAASVLLWLSFAGNVYLMMESVKTKESLVSVNKTNTSLSDSMQALVAGYKQMQNDMAILKDPMYKIINLKGLKPSPDAKALVCWCPMDKKVYVDIEKLPAPPNGMQYQLWAIVNGKPVSEGMITPGIGLHKMTDVDHAQAFSVTLEKQAGSPNPTGEMYVTGSI